MKKLFVSFTALLHALRVRKVCMEDLSTGLYVFGCSREHALEPDKYGSANEVEWFWRENMAEGWRVHGLLKEALIQAEADGRVLWRDRDDERMPYESLSNFLVRNGFDSIAWQHDGRRWNSANEYCYPGVEDRVRERGIPLHVIR